MKENVGTADRIARSIVGPALMGLGYGMWGGNEGKIGGLAAIVAGTTLVESAITRVCPLNALFGLDTREQRLIEKDYRGVVPRYEHETYDLREGYAPRAM